MQVDEIILKGFLNNDLVSISLEGFLGILKIQINNL